MNPRGPMQSVIGVVNDAKQISPRDRGMGVVYLSAARASIASILAVRTAGPPEPTPLPPSRHQLDAIAAGSLPIEKIRTIAEMLDEAIAQERLMSAIALVLVALVIAIGCVGLYAVMSYDVARRTRELGIRLALGATSRSVVTMVLRDSAALVLPGLAIGVPAGDCGEPPAVVAALRRADRRSLDAGRGGAGAGRGRAAGDAPARSHAPRASIRSRC